MRKSRFTAEQAAHAVAQVEAGVPLEDVCRKMGHSGSLLPVRTVSRFPAIPLTEGPPVGRRCGA
jgi:hypothetical protein